MASVQDALRRYGGMYGSAWSSGVMLAEVVEVTGAVEVNRVEVPLVGQTKQGYKPGRESRDGTMRIHKIDATWELKLYQFLATNLAKRRASRGQGLGQFDLKLSIDDPDAYDKEEWTLFGVQIWRMPLGFSITDDIIDREFPITWEREEPTHAFTVDRTTGAVNPYDLNS
jgi:hypothetical protein